MTPNQLGVLRVANELGEIDRFKVSRQLGISTDYAASLCAWLTRERYLSPAVGRRAYRLTKKGSEAIAAELYRAAGILDKRLAQLSLQRGEVSRQIERLHREKLSRPSE
jgi:hypothetical protein